MFILFLQSPVLYSAGSINDLREPLEYIHTKYCKTSDLYLIGNSMGANIVANYVGEEGARCFLKAACCVQAPMKMCHFGENLEKRFFGVYNYGLGRMIKAKMEVVAPNIKEAYLENHGIDVDEALRKSRHLIDIETHMTSIAFGYKTFDNYYDKASCHHRIPLINTPTFFLNARDDPIIGEQAIDREACEKNTYCLLGTTRRGGHLGYFESVTSSRQWFTQPVFEFLNYFQS